MFTNTFSSRQLPRALAAEQKIRLNRLPVRVVSGVMNTINGKAFFVQPGDVITLRNRPNVRKMYREVVDSTSRQSVDWISFDAKDLEARVQALPTGNDATVPDIEIGRVIAFMAR